MKGPGTQVRPALRDSSGHLGRGLVDPHRPEKDKEGSDGSKVPQSWMGDFICHFPRDMQGAGHKAVCVCMCVL